jgi:3-oxoacyl-[acyl-carrier-protein] synthase II
MKTKAYIVAMSSIDVLGNSPGVSAIRFRSGESNIDDHSNGMVEIDNDRLERPDKIPHGIWKSWEKINKIGAVVVDNLISKLPLELPESTAVIFSTQTDGLSNFEGLHNGDRLPPKRVLSNGRDFLVGYINKLYGFNAVSTSMAAACATGLYNLEYGMRLLDEHEFVIVGSADAGTSKLSMDYFRTLNAIGTKSTPFDKDRDGFVMGEGGAAVVICSKSTIIKYGLTPEAVVHDVQLTNDGLSGSLTDPHGTSTPKGDPHEIEQIANLVPWLPIVSFKSMLGHTIGTSGLLEMLHAIIHIKSGVVPANRNLESSIDNRCIVDHMETEKKFFINNAFGFGGKCASAFVEVTNKVSKL